MTSPIDPIRRTERVRRTKRAIADRAEEAQETSALPVPVGQAATPAPKAPIGLAAQLLGESERRGLRGGPPVLQAAKTAYVKTEWSGSADRRAPKGRLTKKEI